MQKTYKARILQAFGSRHMHLKELMPIYTRYAMKYREQAPLFTSPFLINLLLWFFYWFPIFNYYYYSIFYRGLVRRSSTWLQCLPADWGKTVHISIFISIFFFIIAVILSRRRFNNSLDENETIHHCVDCVKWFFIFDSVFLNAKLHWILNAGGSLIYFSILFHSYVKWFIQN